MKCRQIENRLLEYMAGAIAPAERRAIDLHAQSCPLCAERIQGFGDISALLDSWKGVEVSAGFNAQLQRRLREEPAAAWWSRLFPRMAGLPLHSPVFAVALLMIVSMAAVLMKYFPAEPQTLARPQNPFVQVVADSGTDDLSLYRDLPMFEDMDVLRNFEVLQVLSENKQ